MNQIKKMFDRFLSGKPIIKSERWRLFPIIIGKKSNNAPIYMLCVLNHNHLWMIINPKSGYDLITVYERTPETLSDKRGANAIKRMLPEYADQLSSYTKKLNDGNNDVLLLRKPMKYNYFNSNNDYIGGYMN